MKRLIACCVLAVVGSYGAVANAAPAPKATGGVEFFGSSSAQSLEFNAHDGGPSVNDKGALTYTNYTAGISYSAEVWCANVDVDGKTAYLAYEIPPGLPGLSGLGIVFRVIDGGTPGTNGDQISFGIFASGAGAVAACEAGSLGTVVIDNTVTSGNLVVHKK